jgi:asparagine synthase (glutamine-hydrolysing)
MCGVVALLHLDGRPVDERELVAMRDLMTHRGPDEAGSFVDGAAGLGHRRLQIIDLGGGHQPMANASGTVHVVFNGEIYNYRELQKLIESRGITLQTNSDTETILGLYELFGLDFVDHLTGMFSIVLWDATRRRLVAVRDRVGIKPLYILRTAKTIAFASETKAFLGLSSWTPEVAAERIPEYLVYRDLAGSGTLTGGVDRVAPGEMIVVEDGREKRHRYWDLPLPTSTEDSSRSVDDWVEEVDDLLQRVIRAHLMSDVPLGAFNSGGLDSSLVAALAARCIDQPLNTYSLGFDDPAFDESAYARIVSDRLQTSHHPLIVSDREFADHLPEAIWHLDEPLSHPNCVLLFCLSHLAKQTVTVVLTGEGADEVFGGYPRYRLPRLLDRLHNLGPLVRPLMLAASKLRSGRERARIESIVSSRDGVDVRSLSAFVADDLVRSLMSAEPASSPVVDAGLGTRPTTPNLFVHTLHHDQTRYLETLLHRLDKMSMAASLEGRVPLLDHRVVELAARIPPSLKLRGFRTKFLLKTVGERYLPNEIIHRKKVGLGVPISDWTRTGGGLSDHVSLLLEPNAACRAYMEAAPLRGVVEAHRAGEADHGELLWSLINLELWLRTFKQRSAASANLAATSPQPAASH